MKHTQGRPGTSTEEPAGRRRAPGRPGHDSDRLALERGEPCGEDCRIWHGASAAYRRCSIRAQPIRGSDGNIAEWWVSIADVDEPPIDLQEMVRLNDALTSQLGAHNQELECLFSVSLDVLLTMDTDGRLVTVSPSAAAVAGVPYAQIVRQPFDRLLHPDDVEATWAEVRRVFTGEHQSIDFGTRVRRPDGSVRHVVWRTVGSPERGRLYAVGRDVTEWRMDEGRLMRAQRLEAVGQLTGGIAHDFNNVLAAVLSYIEVARRTSDPEMVEKTLSAAADVGRRGAALVSQLLTFARKRELALAPVDVNELLLRLQDLLRRTLGGSVTVQYDLAHGAYKTLADPT